MIESFPPDLQQFVNQQVTAGNYETELALVQRAVELLKIHSENYERFRAEVRERVEALDAGDYIELNGDEELAAFFAELKREVDDELAGRRGDQG